MLPRSLLLSYAWRTSSINVYRLMNFLMAEHLARGGKANGKLKATYDQLVHAGITRRLINETIREAEHRGLIRVTRGGQRIATTFSLSWLPAADGQPPADEWRDYKGDKAPKPDNHGARQSHGKRDGVLH
jgi:hypothetical protein